MSTTGTWLDKDSGKIVHKAPRRGRLLVAPGREATNAEKALVELYESNVTTTADEFHAAPATAPAPAKKAPAKKAPAVKG
jgi:hypothetical protein